MEALKCFCSRKVGKVVGVSRACKVSSIGVARSAHSIPFWSLFHVFDKTHPPKAQFQSWPPQTDQSAWYAHASCTSLRLDYMLLKGSYVVPFWGSILESPIANPKKRNYIGASRWGLQGLGLLLVGCSASAGQLRKHHTHC